ncbi:hypothetical protein ACOMHN_014353 [Nucella lapillus]
MGKPKKGKKGHDDDFEDDEVSVDPSANADTEDMDDQLTNKAAKKAKKGKKNKKDDLDEVEREIAAMALEANGGQTEDPEAEVQPAAKKKEKKKKKQERDEEGGEEAPQKSRFQMLLMSDDDEGGKDSEEEEAESSKNEIVLASVGDQDSHNKSKKDKKKNKKGKAKTAEEEDVDAILAALDEPTEKKKGKKKKMTTKAAAEDEDAAEDEAAGEEEAKEEQPVVEVEKQAPRVVTIDDYESDDDSKKKKKKKNKKKEEAEGEKEEGEEEGEEGGTVKTAAQKKKEKKERERQKKLQKGQHQGKEDGVGGSVAATAEAEATSESREATPAAPEVGEEGEADGEGEKDGKKKKKKKGEKEKEEKKPKNAAMLAKIKEQQAKIREEEDRRKKEEEEAERLDEERIHKFEEAKKQEEERRLKRKQKKKEREERLKKEGKFLTEKQKQDRLRLNQMLDIIKEQGGSVPNKDEVPKKRPFYGKKKKDTQQREDASEKSPSPEDEQAPDLACEEAVPAEEERVEEKMEVKEEEEENEIKDAWDEESEEEKEEDGRGESKSKTRVKKQESEESKDSEEEDEDSEDEESSEVEECSEESESDDDLTPAQRGREKVLKRQHAAEEHRTTDVLRAPVVCVLGHVDTGKTKILDKLRRTNVQDGEAGGITQQIGATNVPREAIVEKTKMCKDFTKAELKLPGLLIIDTPGHESFSNLRSRGSSLCDIAILVVDIMHALEPQTIESINLLKARKTPFLVALNKIDRLYGWKSYPQNDVLNTIEAQTQHTKAEFDKRATEVITQLAQEGLNAKLFYENKNPKEYVSLVPTSAHSGDGMGNLVALICSLTQTLLARRLAYCDELQATVMEVKALQSMGTTIDVILVNGRVMEGQTMVVAGTEGPIVTPIRGLLMPQPMRELRVKTKAYIPMKEVMAAQGVKIIAKDLEKALAGLPMYIAHDKDEIEYFRQEAERGLEDALQAIKLSDRGVFVQASTLGSLEALLEYLRSVKVKYAGINIGPVHKKDVMKASIMLEHDPQYAVILAFDVEVKRDIQDLADSLAVKVFTADIIYHLFDKFTQFRNDLMKKRQDEYRHLAVFPCKLKIMPQFVFNSRDPIVMGVVVQAGFLKEGTPICVPSKEFVYIGRVGGIEFNHKSVEIARTGQEVCIKILALPGEAPKMFGRHFDADDVLVSKISRESIDCVKDYFRKDMSKTDWVLIMELKKMFEIL